MITKEIEASEKSAHTIPVFRLAISLLLAGVAAWWSIPYALTLRGHFAIGGEYCLIMGVGTLPWLLQGVKAMVRETIGLCDDEDYSI